MKITVLSLRRRTLYTALGLSLILGLPLAGGAQAPKLTKVTPPTAAAKKAPQTTTAYYGVYIQSAKVGALTLDQDRKATYKGKPAVRFVSKMDLSLDVLGTPTEIHSVSTSWSDPKTGAPLALESKTVSAGRESSVTATYTDRSVSYVANVQGSVKKDTLNLGPGERFLADASNGLAAMPPVGTKLKGKVFIPEPAMLKLVDSEMEVASKETIELDGQVIPAFKVLDRNAVAPSTVWVDDAGNMLRTDSILGMRLLKQKKEVALAPAGDKPDLISLVGIKPTGDLPEKPRDLTFARYEFGNVTRPLPPSDAVQQTSRTGDSVTVTITAHPLPTGPTVPLFKSVGDAPASLRPYLSSTLYVQSDLPRFRDLAKKILDGETDAAKAAAKISAYVHGKMNPDPTISNLRTASDLLNDPRGVCRDYTVLYTTLARAAGLPTKQCIGITYFNGAFLGHAWPEVWTGKDENGQDRWTALEPTWGKPFADAAHIKLAEGEMSDFFNVAADMGRYTIKIVETRSPEEKP